MKESFALVFLFFSILLPAQGELKSFQFYSNGQPVNFGDVVDETSKADVVLFGEFHDHAMIHWLQLKMAEELMKRGDVVMGGEFFETDDQLLIDERLSGITPAKKFKAEAKLWPNYETDYAPLLKLAADSQCTFIATNVPRRYASFVARYGLDSLRSIPKKALDLLPPLPVPFSYEVPGYTEMKEMMSGGHGMGMDPENMVMAQALKDYTMAYNIVENRKKDELFFHINGDFHSASYGGIYWYLKYLKPRLKVISIKVEQVDRVGEMPREAMEAGDFILVVPSDFTRTH